MSVRSRLTSGRATAASPAISGSTRKLEAIMERRMVCFIRSRSSCCSDKTGSITLWMEPFTAFIRSSGNCLPRLK